MTQSPSPNSTRSIGILLICHAPLGDALLRCVEHVYGRRPPNVVAIDIVPDANTEALQTQLLELLHTLDEGAGVMILTDLLGGTPANIACQLGQTHHATVLTGVNLPMLLRAITYRNAALEVVVEKAINGARNAILHLATTVPQRQTLTTGTTHDPKHYYDQQ